MALVLIRYAARAITWAGVRILIVAGVLSLAGCASYAERYAQANEQGLAEENEAATLFEALVTRRGELPTS